MRKINIYKKLNTVLIVLLIIVFTTTDTFSLLMSVFDLSSIFKDVLSMESGQNSIIINDEPALWNIDGEEIKGDVWDFICKSDIIKYYYSDYENIGELLLFIEKISNAYKMAWPLTISNKYS